MIDRLPIKPIAIACTAAVIPRVLAYASTKPPSREGILNQVRDHLYRVKVELRETVVQPRNWTIVSEIVTKHGWISALALGYFCEHLKGEFNCEEKMALAALWFSLASVSWGSCELIKKSLSKQLKSGIAE